MPDQLKLDMSDYYEHAGDHLADRNSHSKAAEHYTKAIQVIESIGGIEEDVKETGWTRFTPNVELDRARALIHYKTGISHNKNKKYKDAKVSFDYARVLDPSFEDANAWYDKMDRLTKSLNKIFGD